jgi:predicted Na+-dependent transporter
MSVIISEMAKGNFSFLILVVGIAQLVAMIRRK